VFELAPAADPCPTIGRVRQIFERALVDFPSIDRLVCRETAVCGCEGLPAAIRGVPTSVHENAKRSKLIFFFFLLSAYD
jgi:hypothetical protein